MLKKWNLIFGVGSLCIVFGGVGYTQSISHASERVSSSIIGIKRLPLFLRSHSSIVLQSMTQDHTRPIQLAQHSSTPWWSTSRVQRKFPSTSKMGSLTQVYFPPVGRIEDRWVKISNRRYALSTNIRFMDKRNFTVMPSTIKLPISIAFQLLNNTVYKVWILRQEERSNFKKYLFH